MCGAARPQLALAIIDAALQPRARQLRTILRAAPVVTGENVTFANQKFS